MRKCEDKVRERGTQGSLRTLPPALPCKRTGGYFHTALIHWRTWQTLSSSSTNSNSKWEVRQVIRADCSLRGTRGGCVLEKWLIKPFRTKSESCQSNFAKVPWQGRTAEPAPTSSPASYWAISDCFTTDMWVSSPSREGTYFWFFLLFSLLHLLVHREALPQLLLPGSKRSVNCSCTHHVTLSVHHKLSMSWSIWSQENI